MTETPDFDQIARYLLDRIVDVLPGDTDQRVAAQRRDLFAPDVVEQLRQVWNARGLADIAKLEPILEEPPGAGPPRVVTMKTLDHALRTLDR